MTVKGKAKQAEKIPNTPADDAKNKLADNKKNLIVKALDTNGDGQITIDDIIYHALKAPGIRINREDFLRKEFFKHFPQDVIDKAVESTPAEAGISTDKIERIANAVIAQERIGVTGISAALGVPGGAAMAATIPADILQYYGFTIRAAQELMYLYGFPEIGEDRNGLVIDAETMNSLILCLGVMNGVASANNAIKAMAKALAGGVEKKLLNTALTKGAIYPIIKQILKWFNVKLTKSIFAGTVKKAIPVAGGVIGGGITFATFKPCCKRLQICLADTMLSNPKHVSTADEDKVLGDIVGGEVYEADYEECNDDLSDIVLEDDTRQYYDQDAQEMSYPQVSVSYIYCRHCGKKMPSDSNFCPVCGVKVIK